jgi:dTDP-4-dehydrorhamnose reductase
MKILITGANGQVGKELQHRLSSFGEIVAIDREELDLIDEFGVRSFVRDTRPNLVINAAAYTAVDRAESEPELAHLLNAVAPRILAEETKKVHGVFITYSTDYVFDGDAAEPFTEESQPNPLNCYGRTKLAGDQAVALVGGAYFILRTSWVYGSHGQNFLLTMLRLAAEREELKIVNDQVGAPTSAKSIADVTAQIVRGTSGPSLEGQLSQLQTKSGLYNVSSAGRTSWFGFAQAIFREAAIDHAPRLIPINSRDYPTPASRPKWSVLSGAKLQKAFGITMPQWESSLAQVLDSMGKLKSVELTRTAETG